MSLSITRYLTNANSANTTVYEPANGYASDITMKVGNDGSNAFYALLKVNRSILPPAANVISATLRLAESDTSNRGDNALTVKISRITGTWNANTTWTNKPEYDSAVHCDYQFNSANNPDSSNYFTRRTRYKYGKYSFHGVFIEYVIFSSYEGSYFNTSDLHYEYVGKVYDEYRCWHNINVTSVIQDCIDSGCTGLIFWFDLPGTSGTKKYLFNQNNSDSDYQPRLTIVYDPLPAPTKPVIDSISTVTDREKTFGWSASTDQSGLIEASDIYYELAVYEGAGWGESMPCYPGTSEYTIDLGTYFGLVEGQYYYNSQAKIRLRSCADYNGFIYCSDWAESPAFAIDYRIVPDAPSLSIDISEPYEGQQVVFTAGRPSAYNTYRADGTENSLTYYVRLYDGTLLVSGTAAAFDSMKEIGYIMGNFTSGKADLPVSVRCYCTDSEGQTSPACDWIPMTVKRFRAPVINLGNTDRGETDATVHFTIQDTGYGEPQLYSQINKIQYSLNLGENWYDAALGTWNVLSNSFTISGLSSGTRYNLSVRAVNVAPPDTELPGFTGLSFTATILEHTPVFAVLNDGVYTKGIYVGPDYSKSPEPGTIYNGTNYAVFGPESSQENSIPRYSGEEGRLLKTSSVNIDDNGSVNIPSGQEYKINGVSLLNIVYPVGSIYMSVNSTSPETLFGGTWAVFGEGKVLVGYNGSDTDFNQSEKTGGEKRHTLILSEAPAHSHELKWVDNNSYVSLSANGSGTQVSGYKTGYSSDSIYRNMLIAASQGGGGSHNNLQPYIVVYMWKRTA